MMDALSKTGFALYIPLLPSGTMEMGGGLAKMDVLLRGGVAKVDKLGQGGGGGQKMPILGGRPFWMVPKGTWLD